MIVIPFFTTGLAHTSYLLGGATTGAIVDPRRDIGIYLDAARELGIRITHILETHLHADFISGHLELAVRTGATIYAPKKGKCRFPHIPMREGSRFAIEDISIRVIETPGHTPEHVSYVVTDTSRGKEPVGVFCGDTLFVGDVGRPDLFPGQAKKLASQLYASLHRKLLRLPAFCEVYPAHGAGSLCGRSLGAKRTSTIGYEMKYNPALRIRDRQRFIDSLTTAMPAAPDHFARCSAINARGPVLVKRLRPPSPLSPAAFRQRARRKGAVVLDIRAYEAFGGQHVPGALNLDITGNFATFAGWIIPAGAELLLVPDDENQVAAAVTQLQRVGHDRVTGWLEDGMFGWAKAGFPVGHVRQLTAHDLHALTARGEPLTIVDVRAPSEYKQHHIAGAVNIPVADLRIRWRELDPELPTITLCSTGFRSSLAASLLARRGVTRVSNLAGGMTGFRKAGFAPVCPVCVAPHGPRLEMDEP